MLHQRYIIVKQRYQLRRKNLVEVPQSVLVRYLVKYLNNIIVTRTHYYGLLESLTRSQFLYGLLPSREHQYSMAWVHIMARGSYSYKYRFGNTHQILSI